MPKEEFRKLRKTVWDEPHSFVVIDHSSKKIKESIEED